MSNGAAVKSAPERLFIIRYVRGLWLRYIQRAGPLPPVGQGGRLAQRQPFFKVHCMVAHRRLKSRVPRPFRNSLLRRTRSRILPRQDFQPRVSHQPQGCRISGAGSSTPSSVPCSSSAHINAASISSAALSIGLACICQRALLPMKSSRFVGPAAFYPVGGRCGRPSEPSRHSRNPGSPARRPAAVGAGLTNIWSTSRLSSALASSDSMAGLPRRRYKKAKQKRRRVLNKIRDTSVRSDHLNGAEARVVFCAGIAFFRMPLTFQSGYHKSGYHKSGYHTPSFYAWNAKRTVWVV